MKLLLVLAAAQCFLCAADLRLGIVGTDTSHATAFTAILNDPSSKDHVPGSRVVAAFPGGSGDLPESRDRVGKYAAELQSRWGVEIVPDIASLCAKVDAILLESVDGRIHLAQFRQILKSKKPVFIDKPLASTLADAREIARLAREAGVPWFSSSSLRFSEGLAPLRLAGLNGVLAWGPGPAEPHHELDLAWYGIHTVEMLYALMGAGCDEVTRTTTTDADVVTGRWKDGRLGVVRLIRPYSAFGAVSFAPKQIVASQGDLSVGYAPLLRAVVAFFQTGKTPVPVEETLEIFSFLDAAQRSKSENGVPTRLR